MPIVAYVQIYQAVPTNSALMTNTVILTGIGITVSATIAIGVIAAVL
jgi:ribose 5-phosphate isomerase RpiB